MQTTIYLGEPARPPEGSWWEWKGRQWCTDRSGVFSDALWPARWPPSPQAWLLAADVQGQAKAMLVEAEASLNYVRIIQGFYGRLIVEVGGEKGPELVAFDGRFIAVLVAETPVLTWSPRQRVIAVHDDKGDLIAVVAPLMGRVLYGSPPAEGDGGAA